MSFDGNTTRVILRPIANPLPLGFLAFAGGSLMVSGLQLGWLQPTEGHDVALILLGFVFPLQLIACVFGYLGRDVVAGTVMGLLAGTWLSFSLVELGAPPGSTSDALGLFLLVVSASLAVPAIAAATGKLVPAAVLTLAAARFVLTGLYQLTSSSTWEDISGVVGVVLCGLALYTALALVLEDARRRTLLPIGRRDARKGGIGNEAGVRPQL
jgi:succinate-acetate transporter protein